MTNPWYYQNILTSDAQDDLFPEDLNPLNPKNFLALNQYVANGTCLPTNIDELIAYLNIDWPDAGPLFNSAVKNITQFVSMMQTYAAITDHSIAYQNNIAPLVNTRFCCKVF
ncbi:MAG: hypothetical protein QM671_28015 [Bacillus sp. (in: firmicutes)]|uniref:hypothetical protein n=1 Tax=Bacillus sp. TaxID=1409 RepID=UPI0039E231A8